MPVIRTATFSLADGDDWVTGTALAATRGPLAVGGLAASLGLSMLLCREVARAYHPSMRALPRSAERELLDGLDPDPVELRRNLREMATLNRLPGGVGASVAAVLRLTSGAAADWPILDVGTGSADFVRRLRERTRMPVVVSDAHPSVLAIARRNVAGMDDVTVVQADARDLPFADGSMAVAHASLLLHHLDPPDAVSALREMRRVARHGVVVNDLRRSRLAFVMTALPVLVLSRARFTRRDGVLSARRAYTLPELDDLAAEAGLRPVARTTAWWPRVTTTYR
jgi:SAM-dependent methyltransferase